MNEFTLETLPGNLKVVKKSDTTIFGIRVYLIHWGWLHS